MSSRHERPIFIVGAPRSGTTMLRYMLCAHPRIYIPPESNFILRFLSYPPQKALSKPELEDLVEKILSYKVFFRDWPDRQLDSHEFVNSLPDLTPYTMLKSLYHQYAGHHRAERWGDKSPIYCSHISNIAKFFPSAQFVHIIRDGRDVALSMMEAYKGFRFFYMDLCYAARSWHRRVRKGRSDGKTLEVGRYIELRYEQLVSNPETVLEKLCEFLGESFVPEMAAPFQVAAKQYHSSGIHASNRKPVNTDSIGRWRNKMSKSDQRLFQAFTSDLLQDLGYETVSVEKLSLREIARITRLQIKYSTVESGRRILRAAGVVHPAGLFLKIKKRMQKKS